MEKTIVVRKDSRGNIIAIKTEKNVYDYDTAIHMAKTGQLAHVDSFNRSGRDILRSEPDKTTENNLDNLPEF